MILGFSASLERRGRPGAEPYDRGVTRRHDLLDGPDARAWKRGWEIVNALTDREAMQRTAEERLVELDELYRFALRAQRPDPWSDLEVEEVRERWVALRRRLGGAL